MRILMVSIASPHFFNWTEQLKNSGHEVYWFDVFDSNTKVEKIDFAQQITGWRYKLDYPGRYFLKKSFPELSQLINKFNERTLADVFEQKIIEIQPDVVHSFVMHLSCFPIFEVMKKNPRIKWIYSSWGSDLYYYFEQQKKESQRIQKILPSIDYMFSDCVRDHKLASKNGFCGKFLGRFPGRGGFDFQEANPYMKQYEDKKTIIIKGNQGKHGRCIKVLKAISDLEEEIGSHKIIIFGADEEVNEYIEKSNLRNFGNLSILGKISYSEVLKLMGKSLIYIGNSSSDGMPNTLLEAIIMGVFPVQSNPGGATAEIIEHGKNGLLIEDPENSKEIKGLLIRALQDKKMIKTAVEYNLDNLKLNIERGLVKKQVLEKYQLVEREL